MVDIDFLPIFLDEAFETLELWESACLRLESEVSDDLISELFRYAHNIKGSSRSVGLESFGRLVHTAEDFITKIKQKELTVDDRVIAVLLDTQNFLISWVEHLRDDPNCELDFLELEKRFRSLSAPKVPSEKHEPENLGFGFFDDDNEDDTVPAQTPSNDTQIAEKGPVQDLHQDGQSEVNTNRKPQPIVAAKPAARSDETIRVSTKKLDSVIRLIGELSIQHAIVRNAKETKRLNEDHALEAIDLTHKVMQDLQSEAMSLRMQPLESLFQRMERVSKDVARDQGKHIAVDIKGADVELDKTVIEKVKDPLVHILRNAVDHGIESTQRRIELGKPEKATITIEGMQTASSVSIQISDDGRGLNLAKILDKAKKNGLITDQTDLSSQEIAQLIFSPGLSTADSVTDVSGRGVGMDVVKQAVDSLGGNISIHTKQDQGTVFTISLPSTLSILDAIVVGLANKFYAVPIQDVDEVVDLSALSIQSTSQQGRVINLRGSILPVQCLGSYLPERDGKSSEDYSGIALITRQNGSSVAFKVDTLEGQQSIVVRQLEGKLAELPGFTGATILSSGEPAMIIHLPHIVKSYLSAIA